MTHYLAHVFTDVLLVAFITRPPSFKLDGRPHTCRH